MAEKSDPFQAPTPPHRTLTHPSLARRYKYISNYAHERHRQQSVVLKVEEHVADALRILLGIRIMASQTNSLNMNPLTESHCTAQLHAFSIYRLSRKATQAVEIGSYWTSSPAFASRSMRMRHSAWSSFRFVRSRLTCPTDETVTADFLAGMQEEKIFT